MGISAARPQSRCLRRGLAVLGELNRRRYASAAEIGRSIGVPRPTVHRLLLALAEEGYVHAVGETEHFAPAARTAELSEGWTIEAQAVEVASQLVGDVAAASDWPMDLAVHDRGSMLVRYSTYDQAAWSLLPNSPVGQRIPMCGTAPGRMFLAGLTPLQREPLIADAGVTERHEVEVAERRGYALRDGGVVPRTVSIAVPVRNQGSTVLCLSMAFIRSSIDVPTVIGTYLPLLRSIVASTEHTLIGRSL